MVVIFSGYNQRAVIAFLRCLKKNKIENYAIIAASEDDTILMTDYKDKVFYIRKNKELNKEEIINIIEKLTSFSNNSPLLIAPSTEALNRFLLQNRQELEEKNCIIPIPDIKLYEDISDKEAFWHICKETGLEVPQLIATPITFNAPFVAKPKRYFANDGKVYSPVIVKSEREYNKFVELYSNTDFTFQEYIDGESFYLLYYFAKDGTFYCFSQVNYAQQSGGKSIIAAECSDLHMDRISDSYVKLLNKLKYHGFIMIELRKSNDVYYMIEANPRFWGPSQLYLDSGVPFFEAFLHDYGILEKVPVNTIDVDKKYFWGGGVKKDILNDDNCVWLGSGKRIVGNNLTEFQRADIYNRSDTIRIFESENIK